MYQIQYSRSEIFECEYCMELILTGTIKLGKEKVNWLENVMRCGLGFFLRR